MRKFVLFMNELMDCHEIVIEDGGHVLSRIYVGNELAGVGRCLAGFPAVYVVYDRNVEMQATALLLSLREQGIRFADSCPLFATEEEKCMDTVTGLCRWLMEKGADRNALLLAVGGGITTDMAGFAASVYKRGIRFAYLPTTLLAQVDAAIGGKTGVNLDSYKNMIGVIRQPEFTWLCPEVLSSLDYRTFLSGAAEMLKTFIISDGGWYDRAVRFLSEMNGFCYRDFISSRKTEFAAMIAAAASVKARIVSADQFERGERRKLNLGHTFAHAIEWRSHSISHGQAVSVGIVCAARLSAALGLCPGDLPDMLAGDLGRCGLETALPFRLADLHDAMLKDKKAEDGSVRFVLIRGIGDTDVVSLTVDEALAALS